MQFCNEFRDICFSCVISNVLFVMFQDILGEVKNDRVVVAIRAVSVITLQSWILFLSDAEHNVRSMLDVPLAK